ncbi:MAG: hypothetical protein US74_C0026G0006, partial [Parcubacteria group bacterium GW2011_GWA2_38_13]
MTNDTPIKSTSSLQGKTKYIFIFVLIIFLAIGVIASVYFYTNKTGTDNSSQTFKEPYRLVSEKISQSALIKIFLPTQVHAEYAKANIEISPKIEGTWIAAEEQDAIAFKPKEKLQNKNYYSVALAMPDGGKMEEEFVAVEDPKILAVFPKDGSEASENSEITIVFNRPMVPLTTLGYLDGKDVPVEITPKTNGRFKWITTKNLQFIPKTRLLRSSKYTITIKPGLTSMDGLAVIGGTFSFTTRHVRYVDVTKDTIIYNEPISIYFNQPVDIDEVKKNIKVRSMVKGTVPGRDIPFIAEYKNYVPMPGEKISKDELLDMNQSVVEIYNKEDRFGRKKMWDFETQYLLEISRALPLEGDIALDEKRETFVNIPSPIAGMGAESDRTQLADTDFVDPQGKIWIMFYEDVDINSVRIRVPHLKDMVYGEKCKDENLSMAYGNSDCEKVVDKKKIYITLRDTEVGLGEKMDFVFEKIVNTNGLVINKDPLIHQFISYPEFKILQTKPLANINGSSLTEIIVCSNSPLYIPLVQERLDFISGSPEHELGYWENSWRVTEPVSSSPCNTNEFSTTIHYGLMPETKYSFAFHFKDAFGQKTDYSLGFVSGKMPNNQLEILHMQPVYNVTSPEKTKLVFAEKNMEYIEMRICKLDASSFLNYLDNKPNIFSGFESINGCSSIAKDRINLPKRYWLNNYFTIDLKEYFEDSVGNYILTFSNPNYMQTYWDDTMNGQRSRQAYERSYLTVTRLAVAEKKVTIMSEAWNGKTEWESGKLLDNEEASGLSNLYWVTDLTTLEPVQGASVQFYKKDKIAGYIYNSEFLTNADGVVTPPSARGQMAAIIRRGDDSTILPAYDSKFNWATDAYSEYKIYMYTDKPIYRPGQEVEIKGIYRVGYDGNYTIVTDRKVHTKIVNSRGDEVKAEELSVSDFGTFNTKFLIGKDSPLGSYRACTENYSCTYFDVLEYVPSAFKVEMKTDKEEYISKDIANIDISVNYYFGVPLSSGEVEYTFSVQNYYFDKYLGGDFNFGFGNDFFQPYFYQDRFIKRGKTVLTQDGKAKISEVIDFDIWFKDKEERKSKIVVLDVTAKNSFGQSVSSQKSFLVHAGEFYLNVDSDKNFFAKSETFNVKVKSIDTKGKTMRVNNIKMDINKLNWVYAKRQEATGGYSYKWEKQQKLVQSFVLNTDSNGDAMKALSLAEEGEYEAQASSPDPKGNVVFGMANFYVYGTGVVGIEPRNDTGLELVSDKTNVNVGEKAEFIIKSPYPKAKALIAIERGKVYSYEIKDITGNLYSYNFPVIEKHIPNVYASVLLVSTKPEVRFGQIEFKVNADHEKLDINVVSDKKFYLPGELVNLDITAKDYNGSPAETELSISVVDLSVLALKGNPKKDPVVFFYGGFPLAVSTASNVKNILIEAAIPATKGGGGAQEEDKNGLDTKKRGNFRETAFWQAQAKTDAQGKAKISFTLPDNLTTWQAETLGVTKDTKLGVNYLEFTAKKSLMAIPLKPRFVVAGDEFSIGTEVFNQSDVRQDIIVSIQSSTLTLKDNASKKISVQANESKSVYFSVQAPPSMESGRHIFIISAKGQGIEDTIEQTISITRNDTYEATATAGYATEARVKEYVFLPDSIIKDKGGLKIQASATLSVFLSDALNYMLEYPYGCTEQISSRLNAIAVIKRGLDIPNIGDTFQLKKVEYDGNEYTIDDLVDIGLAALYNNQKSDGGFSLWQEFPQSSFYATLDAVQMLDNLDRAGYKVNTDSVNRAVAYILDKALHDKNISNSKDNIILAAYILSSLQNNSQSTILNQRVYDIARDDLYVKEKISNSALAYLDMVLAKGSSSALEKKISDTLDNRVNIDSRGANLSANDNFLWYYYETPIKDTALYLKSIVAKKSANPISDKVLRWILNSREKDGAWGSTSNTIAAIDALIDYMEWKKENESNFVLDISLDTKNIGSIEFGPKNILEQYLRETPISGLALNKNIPVEFSKENKNSLLNNFYYDMSLKYYLPQDQIPPRDEGFSISREYYMLDDEKNTKPLATAATGDVVRVHLQITVPQTRNFVSIEDFIPAGFEIVNLDLATEQKSLRLQEQELEGREFIPQIKELRDDRAFLYQENVYPGVYEYDYFIRALVKGKYTHMPAVVSEMYFPENFGRTRGGYFE